MKTQARCTSKVGIVDKSLSNLYHVQTDNIRDSQAKYSHATLKDRAALNMASWLGQRELFDADRRCRKGPHGR